MTQCVSCCVSVSSSNATTTYCPRSGRGGILGEDDGWRNVNIVYHYRMCAYECVCVQPWVGVGVGMCAYEYVISQCCFDAISVIIITRNKAR